MVRDVFLKAILLKNSKKRKRGEGGQVEALHYNKKNLMFDNHDQDNKTFLKIS